VALKVPMEQYVADAKFIRRFHREAEVAQRLDHVNIVRTFEHGSLGPQHYMAMEYVDGRSLEGYIEAGELTIDLSVAIMRASPTRCSTSTPWGSSTATSSPPTS
jgi:eukaryotic-like serine/threonine-protein kinase